MPRLNKTARWIYGPAAAALAAALLLPGKSHADTSYLRPNIFTAAKADMVTVQSSFTEDFPNPSVAVATDQWKVIRPDGREDRFDRVEAFKQVTILETDVAETGTYRLSTGERLGRLGQQVLVDGVWKPWGPETEIPAGAQTRKSQTATVADVYITLGAPTKQAVDARIGRLELKPTTHPNDVYLDSGFQFRVLLDGKPVANQDVEIWREGGASEEPQFRKVLKSAKDGAVDVKFDKAGVYLIWTRLSAEAPPGSPAPIRSYTTSLTIEVQN